MGTDPKRYTPADVRESGLAKVVEDGMRTHTGVVGIALHILNEWVLEHDQQLLQQWDRLPELDNHHNAALCPYCSGTVLPEHDRRVRSAAIDELLADLPDDGGWQSGARDWLIARRDFSQAEASRWYQCERKVSYQSSDAAEKIAKNLQQRKPRHEHGPKPYWCTHCGNWHIGHGDGIDSQKSRYDARREYAAHLANQTEKERHGSPRAVPMSKSASPGKAVPPETTVAPAAPQMQTVEEAFKEEAAALREQEPRCNEPHPDFHGRRCTRSPGHKPPCIDGIVRWTPRSMEQP